jgi:hypothetical protein
VENAGQYNNAFHPEGKDAEKTNRKQKERTRGEREENFLATYNA